MSKKADKRYQTAEEMALDIKRYLKRTRRELERAPKVPAAQEVELVSRTESRAVTMPLFLASCAVALGLMIAAYLLWRN
jgi:hypothetical protein